jgi:hypothetical protein
MGALLSGCFMSTAPKFPPGTAVPAFGDGGRYSVFEHKGDGNYIRQETFVVRRVADGSYEFINEKKAVLPISFHDIGDGALVGQAKPRPDRNVYGYVVLTRSGNESLLHAPQCDGQDQALLTAFGVEQRKKYECFIDNVTDAAKLFSQLKRGEPASKMIPE